MMRFRKRYSYSVTARIVSDDAQLTQQQMDAIALAVADALRDQGAVLSVRQNNELVTVRLADTVWLDESLPWPL
jgi:hypothetical protein